MSYFFPSVSLDSSINLKLQTLQLHTTHDKYILLSTTHEKYILLSNVADIFCLPSSLLPSFFSSFLPPFLLLPSPLFSFFSFHFFFLPFLVPHLFFLPSSLILSLFSSFPFLPPIIFFLFLGPHPWHMEVPRLGRIRATAAGHHSHSNTRSESCLQPSPQLTATPDP